MAPSLIICHGQDIQCQHRCLRAWSVQLQCTCSGFRVANTLRKGNTSTADIPFRSYASPDDTVRHVAPRWPRGGHQARKQDRNFRDDPTHLIGRHARDVVVGLMLSCHTALSGYRCRARRCLHVICAHRHTEYLTAGLSIPTIGTGVEPGMSGQVLI